MIEAVVAILIILWVLGYIHIAAFPVPDIVLFTINGHGITVWDILILFAISWAVGVLPYPFKQIAAVLLFFWILSTLGIIAFAGFSSIIVIAVIVGLLFFLTQR